MSFRTVDLYFFNQNVVRNLYFFKLIHLNLMDKSYCLPILKCLHLIFDITDITDIDYLGSSNYFYLLRYFFRTNGSICQYVSKFNLGIWYYSFKIRACLRTFQMFFALNFLVNDIIPKIGKEYLVKNSRNMYIFTILDLNIFLD